LKHEPSLGREEIVRASEMIEQLKVASKQQLPPLYGIGGTAIGGYTILLPVPTPYLKPNPE